MSAALRLSPESVTNPLSFSMVPIETSFVLKKATNLDHDSSKSPSKLADLSNGLISTTGALAHPPKTINVATRKKLFDF